MLSGVTQSVGFLLRRCVEDEVAGECDEHAIGGEESQPVVARLRNEEPVERVVSGELGEVTDALGVLRSTAPPGCQGAATSSP